ncbi:MAG: prolyl oligopeptidase [Alphaproteobacteria bacterium]|nr:prolyl oligopeptidase [Alphaproteobacteria bacterium]
MQIRRISAALVAVAAIVVSISARAETVYPLGASPGGSDLSFPSAPVPFAKENATLMFKPDGPGPFSGLVLMPTCGGHNSSFHVFDWAERALKRGYAVIVVDPLRARGVHRHNCLPPLEVIPARILKDAFDAAEHLRKQPFVSRDKIALMGFSQGAMIGLGAAGARLSQEYRRTPFQAVVSFYPGCEFPKVNRNGRIIDIRYMPPDVKTPLLVLMGELDTETEPEHCVPLLTGQKEKGAPVEWEVYKNATHVFDDVKWSAREFRKKDFRGVDVVYRYNAEVTKMAEDRAFAFIAKQTK